MTKETKKKLAKAIIAWCKEKEVWEDCCIYFDGKAWATWEDWNGTAGAEIAEGVFEYTDKNPKTYMEYTNPDTITMSFEGGLYDILNAYADGWVKLEAEFLAVFESFNCYYELGNAWNLSVWE